LKLDQLVWHMDLTVWTTMPGEPRFDLAPATVMRSPLAFPRHWRKINDAQLAYPLELFQNGTRWVIIDGYHRLCGHVLQRSCVVPVRLHSSECWDRVERRGAETNCALPNPALQTDDHLGRFAPSVGRR
jgi:hypothetical protein